MDNQNTEMKTCKYCMTQIPKKAKICPNCKKKQSHTLRWVVLGILVFLILVSLFGGGNSETTNKDKNPQKVDEVKTSKEETTEKEEPVSNVFNVGDVVETENMRITFISAKEYESDNQFLQAKDGYTYWEFSFKFENISDHDQSVSSMINWECYADNSKCDQSWIGDDNGLDATLSKGRETQGTVMFEVPKDANSIELEYDVNFWKEDKIIFIGK